MWRRRAGNKPALPYSWLTKRLHRNRYMGSCKLLLTQITVTIERFNTMIMEYSRAVRKKNKYLRFPTFR